MNPNYRENSGLGSGVWSSMCNSFNKLHDLEVIPLSAVQKKIGNGQETRFWLDCWGTSSTLAVKYPRLYALEMDKQCFVNQRVDGGSWNWRREIRGGRESEQFDNLIVELGHVSLTDSQDRWIWSFGDMTDFTVKGVRKVIDDFILPSWARKTIWFKFLPRKVIICAWRVLLKRLPMRVNLVSKGIDIPSSLCPICNDHE
ncbi:uncharacterized protein LOC143583771 [Bidens hawaiensis]|uniref:uncharacterized protein LOC143583771 n=1 Tax=Bidens hawaiensis TaxID=980011 RepID=UPI00404A7583